MLEQPFLTDLDTRAQVKGSIDPLGAMAIWSRIGRRVVGNLSTVSNSVRDFKTLVMGFALIEDVHRKVGDTEDIDEIGAFLRWEQLAAYTRAHFNNDKEFRGTTRVQRQLSEGPVVPISVERDCQILANQKSYGLWGLFTVPARTCGLIEAEANLLTESARSLVDVTWRQKLGPTWPILVGLVERDNRKVSLDRLADTLKRVRPVWLKTDAAERAFWKRHLVDGGPSDSTSGRQAILAGLLRDTLNDPDFAFSPRSLRDLAAKAKGRDEQLSENLLAIAASESVLAPAAALFGFVLSRDGQRLDAVARNVSRSWPASLPSIDRDRLERLQPEFSAARGSQMESRLWLAVAASLSAGQYREAIVQLLELNKLVALGRGGAPWVADDSGTLRVRFRDETSTLPAGGEVKNLWRHSYFLDSLRAVVQQLEARDGQ